MIEQNVARVVYKGDGKTQEFPFSFPVLDRKFIFVVISDRNGRERTLTSDYYVDMDKHVVLYPGYPKGEEPAEAERPAVLAPGEKIVIYRNTPVSQLTSLGDKWPFDVCEKALDKLTMIDQENKESISRTVRLAGATEEVEVVLPPPEKDTAIGWSEDGKSVINVPVKRWQEEARAAAEKAQTQASMAMTYKEESKESRNKAEQSEEKAKEYANRAVMAENKVEGYNKDADRKYNDFAETARLKLEMLEQAGNQVEGWKDEAALSYEGANTAKEQAETAARKAGQSETAATSAQTAAETANTNAQAANTAAQEARKNAETAAQAASGAAASAGQSAGAARNAQTVAGLARTAAQAANTDAQKAKDAAEKASMSAEADNRETQAASAAAQGAATQAQAASREAQSASASAASTKTEINTLAEQVRSAESAAATSATQAKQSENAAATSAEEAKNAAAQAERIAGGDFLTTAKATTMFADKSGTATALDSKANKTDVYTKTESDRKYLQKTDKIDAYTKAESDAKYQLKGTYASVEYVDGRVANIVNSAPETLDTLQELAQALGNNPNFATTVANEIGTKADKATTENALMGKATKEELAKNYVQKTIADDTYLQKTDAESTYVAKKDWDATFARFISGSRPGVSINFKNAAFIKFNRPLWDYYDKNESNARYQQKGEYVAKENMYDGNMLKLPNGAKIGAE